MAGGGGAVPIIETEQTESRAMSRNATWKRVRIWGTVVGFAVDFFEMWNVERKSWRAPAARVFTLFESVCVC